MTEVSGLLQSLMVMWKRSFYYLYQKSVQQMNRRANVHRINFPNLAHF